MYIQIYESSLGPDAQSIICLILLHTERPQLNRVLAILSAIELTTSFFEDLLIFSTNKIESAENFCRKKSLFLGKEIIAAFSHRIH